MDIIEKNPDYEIEQYWFQFKPSMIHFYNELKIPSRPILFWSNELNELQTLKQYNKIQERIQRFQILFMIDIIRNYSYYHAYILQTNLKRWNNVCEEIYQINNEFSLKELTEEEKNTNKIYEKIIILFETMLRCVDILQEKNENSKYLISLFKQVEFYIFSQEEDWFMPFLKIAIEFKKVALLDLILLQKNTYEILKKMYPGIFNSSSNNYIKADKIIKKIIKNNL